MKKFKIDFNCTLKGNIFALKIVKSNGNGKLGQTVKKSKKTEYEL